MRAGGAFQGRQLLGNRRRRVAEPEGGSGEGPCPDDFQEGLEMNRIDHWCCLPRRGSCRRRPLYPVTAALRIEASFGESFGESARYQPNSGRCGGMAGGPRKIRVPGDTPRNRDTHGKCGLGDAAEGVHSFCTACGEPAANQRESTEFSGLPCALAVDDGTPE